ncbi:MAG: tetratricopeptide repeat protein [Myxococcales bacterium]|nr:tetratricopeptide repeat protein [Myxococcales bacterium]
MPDPHSEMLRKLKQREIDDLMKAQELNITLLGELRQRSVYTISVAEKFELEQQIERCERQRRELQLRSDELHKELNGIPLDNLPCPRNTQWVDRHEEHVRFHRALLTQREQSRARGGERTPVYVICNGLPGVGKTHFVLEYAYRQIGATYQSVVWIDGSGTGTAKHSDTALRSEAALRSATARAARELSLVTGTSPTEDQLIDALRSYLAKGGPHLVIIDNVDAPSAIGRHLPKRGDVCVVITTRRRDLPFVSESYRIELLSPETALELLRGPTPLTDADEEATATLLAQELGYLPLALMLARKVHQTGLRPSLRELRESIIRIGPARWRPSVDVDPYLLPYAHLSALFEVSYQLLSSDARWLAAAGGYFAPAPIDRDLLCDAGAILARQPIQNELDRDRWLRALEEIDRIGLVERSEHVIKSMAGSRHGIRVRIHLLLQDYLRSVARSEDAAVQAVCEALARRVERTPLLARELHELSHHLPHMECVRSQLREQSPPSSAWIMVVVGLVRFHCLMGRYEEALRLCDGVLPPELLVGAPREAIDLAHQRAFALWRRREYDAALDDYRAVHAWRLQKLGPDDVTTSFPEHDIGSIYIEQGRYAEAKATFAEIAERMQALLVRNGQLGTFDESTRMTQICRALALTGQARSELQLLQTSPPSSADMVATRAERLPRLRQVLAMLDEARVVFRQLRMQDDLFAARPMLVYADALRVQAELTESDAERGPLLHTAEQTARQVLTIRETELGTGHSYLIEVRQVLGRIAVAKGDPQQIGAEYEHALRLSRSLKT